MQTRRAAILPTVIVRFDDSFGLRQAIGLPQLVAQLPEALALTFDFSAVGQMEESAMLALIPALASLHHGAVTVRGIENVEVIRHSKEPQSTAWRPQTLAAS